MGSNNSKRNEDNSIANDVGVRVKNTVTPVIGFRLNIINAIIAIDSSGSMAGSRWNTAVAGVTNCVSQLSDVDKCAILTFNNKVEVITSGDKGSLDMSALNAKTPQGSTALYDAIGAAIPTAIQAHRRLNTALPVNILTYVVLLTDGEDTCSKMSLDEARGLLFLANQTIPNLRVILAGVGLTDENKRIMQQLDVGDEDIKLVYLQSSADIGDLFEHVSVEMGARVQRTLSLTPAA